MVGAFRSSLGQSYLGKVSKFKDIYVECTIIDVDQNAFSESKCTVLYNTYIILNTSFS